MNLSNNEKKLYGSLLLYTLSICENNQKLKEQIFDEYKKEYSEKILDIKFVISRLGLSTIENKKIMMEELIVYISLNRTFEEMQFINYLSKKFSISDNEIKSLFDNILLKSKNQKIDSLDKTELLSAVGASIPLTASFFPTATAGLVSSSLVVGTSAISFLTWIGIPFGVLGLFKIIFNLNKKDEYEKLKQSHEIKINQYKKEANEIQNLINKSIESINFYKKDTIELFEEFEKICQKISNVDIEVKVFLDSFVQVIKKFEDLRNKDELYMEEFDQMSVFDRIKDFFNLYKYTCIDTEKSRLGVEYKKIEADITKHKSISSTVDNVKYYFESIRVLYFQSLEKFEYFLDTELQNQILKGEELKDGKVNIELAPDALLKEFKKLINLTEILKEMCEKGYLTNNIGDVSINNDDIKSIKKMIDEAESNGLFAA